jgi:hypothetical protein
MAISEIAVGLGNQYGGIKERHREVLAPVFANVSKEQLIVLGQEFKQLQQIDSRYEVLFEYVDALVK